MLLRVLVDTCLDPAGCTGEAGPRAGGGAAAGKRHGRCRHGNARHVFLLTLSGLACPRRAQLITRRLAGGRLHEVSLHVVSLTVPGA